MKKSNISGSSGELPPCIKALPLAWDWRFRNIDEKSLREFAKYIHRIVGGDDFIGLRDATNLLKELVEIVLYKGETGEKIDFGWY